MMIYIILSWMAVMLWMALIFKLSSQVAEKSSELSKSIANIVLKTLNKVSHKENIDVGRLNHVVRKNAHFFVYLVLGVLVINALSIGGVYGLRGVIIAVSICVLYAVSDEVHQLFVPGRCGQIKDVIIDSAGASVGIWVYLIISKLW